MAKIEGDLMDETPTPPETPKAKRGRKAKVKAERKPREVTLHWLMRALENGDLTHKLTTEEQQTSSPTIVTGTRSAQAYIRKTGLAGEFLVLAVKATLRPKVETRQIVTFK